jgi:hypothetical protein
MMEALVELVLDLREGVRYPALKVLFMANLCSMNKWFVAPPSTPGFSVFRCCNVLT